MHRYRLCRILDMSQCILTKIGRFPQKTVHIIKVLNIITKKRTNKILFQILCKRIILI